MRTLVLTCPKLDQGKRKSRFAANRFLNVEFIFGITPNELDSASPLHGNQCEFGFGPIPWEPASMAVAHGHLSVWQRVVELNEICLILEDDAVPVPENEFNYHELDNHIEWAELPEKSLLTLWFQGLGLMERYNNDYFRVMPSYANSGLVAYVMMPSVAKILIEGFPNMACPVDHYVLGMGFDQLSPYTVLAPTKNLIEHADGPSLRCAVTE